MTLALAVSLIAGVGVPFAVDAVTHSAAPRWLKSGLAAALAALAGALATVTLTPGEHWTRYIGDVAGAFVVALATHYTGASDPVQQATGNVGVGKPKAS